MNRRQPTSVPAEAVKPPPPHAPPKSMTAKREKELRKDAHRGVCPDGLRGMIHAGMALEIFDALDAERTARDQAEQWVTDLQSGMYINCVYCGHRYGPEDEVPATMADALKEHIERCPKHPMSALKIRTEQVETEIARLKPFMKDLADAYAEAGVLEEEKLIDRIKWLKKRVEELELDLRDADREAASYYAQLEELGAE